MSDKPSKSEDDHDFLKRLVIAHSDLQIALSAITFLGEAEQDTKYNFIELRRFKCYETTFIVAYSRAFSKNRGRYGSLSLKRIGVKLSRDDRALHDLIIDLRNKLYAHSDEEYAHARVDFHSINMPNDIDFVVPHLQFEEGLEFADLKKRLAAIDLISKIMHGVFKTMQSIGQTSTEKSLYISRPQALSSR